MFQCERWSARHASEARRYFDRWSDEGLRFVWGSKNYDADAARWYRAPDIMAERLEPWLSGEARILDVGCGTGLSGRHLIRAGHSVSGIDLSAGMAEKARQRGYREVRVGDATEMEWPGAFDCVLCVGLIGDWIPPEQLLPRLSNALQPSGIVAVTVPQWSGHALSTRSWLVANGFRIEEHHSAIGFRKSFLHRQRYDFLIARYRM